jgi:hypothetical protein
MSYICKENATDTVEGGDHLLLFGLFTKLSKAARGLRHSSVVSAPARLGCRETR